VTAQGSKRVSVAALIAARPGTPGRARLIYRTHLDRGYGTHRRKGFTETDYARLLAGAHQQLGGAIVLVWDNLPTHVSRKMRQLIAARPWLTVYQLPAYALSSTRWKYGKRISTAEGRDRFLRPGSDRWMRFWRARSASPRAVR